MLLNHPKHLDYYNLFDYLKYDNWYYTIKIDGINITYNKDTNYLKDSIRYKTQKMFSSVLNVVKSKYPKYNYIEMEYLHGKNIIFIFDKILEDRIILESNIPIEELIEEYYNRINNDENLILEKPYFKINNNNKLVILKQLFGLLNDDKLNSFADGFILTNFDTKMNIKVKPLSQITIDLQYNNNIFIDSDNNKYNLDIDNIELTNNKIYQLNKIDNKWKVNRCRSDKMKPNNSLIISQILKIIEYYQDLIYYINKIDGIYLEKFYKNNYYSIPKDNLLDNKLFIDNHKIIMNRFITKIKEDNITFQGILDLGCGTGYITLNNFKFDNWLGIDMDYTKIQQIHNKYVNNNKIKYILEDLNSCEVSSEFKQCNYDKSLYDTLFMINSCHYYQTSNFKNYINQYNFKNIYILTMNPSLICNCKKDELNNITFVHPKNNNSWTEPLFDINYWIDIFGFIPTKEINIGKDIEDNWFKNHKLIIFNR